MNREHFDREHTPALEFQDFVMDALQRDGLFTAFYCSSKFQKTHGEGFLIECKRDIQRRETGNLYVEFEQEVRKDRWEPSGIFKKDRTWLWAIGDEEEFFIISRWTLQQFQRGQRFAVGNATRKGDVPTRGILVPASEIARFAARHYLHGKPLDEFRRLREIKRFRAIESKGFAAHGV